MARTLTEEEFERVKAQVLASAPPNMSEATFNKWAPAQLAAAIAEAELRPPALEGGPGTRFAASAGPYVNPITMATGLWESIKDQPAVTRTLENIWDASVDQFGKAKEAYQQGRYSEAVGHGLAVAPVLGPAAAAAGEQFGRGDIAGGLGSAVGLIGSVVAPGVVKSASRTAPVVAARTAVADVIGRQAVPLVRAGLKTPLTLLKQQAGASTTGVTVQANRLAKFIIDNRITTPGKATQIIKNAEAELQRILAMKGQVATDAPARAMLYLDILEQQAARALTPDHAATIRAAAADLLKGPLGETVPVPTTSPQPSQQFTRVLRPEVPAAEALDIARATSRFETRRSWGEQKGTAMEATKAAERAVRDAFKVALPEARTPLERQGQAILAQKVLDRQVWRELNRDVVSLPGLVGLTSNAVIGFAAHWLRNNQLRAGIWADQLAQAIAGKNAAAATSILSRLKVRLPSLGVLLEQQRQALPLAAPMGSQADTP